MSNLTARRAAVRARMDAHRREGEAIVRELEELQADAPPAIAADTGSAERTPTSARAPETPDEIFAAWGHAAVARAWAATLLHVVEDLAAWEPLLRKHHAATRLADIAARYGIPLPALLDLMHEFRLTVRFADATRPFIQKGAAKMLAKAPAVFEKAARLIDEGRALYAARLSEYLQHAAAALVESRTRNAPPRTTDATRAVDRFVIQLQQSGLVVERHDPERGTHHIITGVPTELDRVRIALAALAHLARFDARAACLPDGRPLLPKRQGRKQESAHLLACTRRFEKVFAERTGGAITKADLATLVAFALPEPDALGHALASGTPAESLRKRGQRDRYAKARVPPAKRDRRG